MVHHLEPSSCQRRVLPTKLQQGAIPLPYRSGVGLLRLCREPWFPLEPDRVLVLPDGVEDLWSDDYAELVDLA